MALEGVAEGMGLGVLAGILAVGIGIIFLIVVALYVYQALAWQTIAKKLKHKYPWLAWIPFAATALKLQLGGFHWAWTFLWLLPVLGWIPLFVLLVISLWRICEKRKYPGWLSLLFVLGFIPKVGGLAAIGSLILIGFLAWGKK